MKKALLFAVCIIGIFVLSAGLFGFNRKPMQTYIIVSGTSTFELESSVSFRLGGGYTCVGGVTTYLDRGEAYLHAGDGEVRKAVSYQLTLQKSHMKKIMLPAAVCAVFFATAQKTGIGTPNPQATLDVNGNLRVGGTAKYMGYDSSSGKISWVNSALFVSAPQYLVQHSASAEGLYYGNGKLLYRGVSDTAFYTDWITGNGYFKGMTGIGTMTPGEKLEVAGNIKANNYKFSTPKTYYYAIPDGAFTARSSPEAVNKSFSNGGANVVGATTNFGLVAPVHLPHNARLISITADFYDVSATQNMILYFVTQFNSGFSLDIDITSAGNAGLNTQTLAVSPSRLIDNFNNAYEIFVVPSTGAWNSSDLAIRRVMLAYTLDEAQ